MLYVATDHQINLVYFMGNERGLIMPDDDPASGLATIRTCDECGHARMRTIAGRLLMACERTGEPEPTTSRDYCSRSIPR